MFPAIPNQTFPSYQFPHIKYLEKLYYLDQLFLQPLVIITFWSLNITFILVGEFQLEWFAIIFVIAYIALEA